jgi:hypothetical protein
MPPNRRVARLVYKQAFPILNEHLAIPAAPNSHFKSEELLESLVYLSLGKRYAESGLEDLRCTREAPSSDTLLRRLKMVKSEDAHGMLVQANDEVIRKLKRRRVFRMPVLAAIDYSDDRFYGRYNSKIRRSKKDRGTNLFYTHASLHVVESGKRVTIFTVPVLPLDDHALIAEKLIQAARVRGIKIHTLLIDRGFSSVDVKNTLDRLRIRYLTPAIKNDNVKEAIEDHDDGLIPAMIRFTMKNAERREASFNLLMYRKPDAKASDPVHKRYIAFATNMPCDEALTVFSLLPDEYRRRWGIESGFRVQDNVQAKTTSTNYTVRTVYLMLSIFLYNVWILANVMLADILGIVEPRKKKPLMKLSQMAKFFTMRIERPGDSHQS